MSINVLSSVLVLGVIGIGVCALATSSGTEEKVEDLASRILSKRPYTEEEKKALKGWVKWCNESLPENLRYTGNFTMYYSS